MLTRYALWFGRRNPTFISILCIIVDFIEWNLLSSSEIFTPVQLTHSPNISEFKAIKHHFFENNM